MRIKEIKVAAFNSVQDIEDNDYALITADANRDIAVAVADDHYCTENFCDIHAALDAGFPRIAAGLLSGATECAHVDAVVCAHMFNGTLPPEQDPRRDMYSLPEWEEWALWFKNNARRCRSCDGYGFEVEVGWSCGNCGGSYGYRTGDTVSFWRSAIEEDVSEDYIIDAEVGAFDGLVEMPDDALPEDVYWLKVVDLSSGRVHEIRTDYLSTERSKHGCH